MASPKTFTAFQGPGRLAGGTLAEVVDAIRQRGMRLNRVLVFEDATGELLKLNTEADLQAVDADEHSARSGASQVALEVRILGRDREWLERQSGGASAAVRRLVAAARRDPQNQAREAREAAYRFIAMLAGDLVGYEEACRALFAGDLARFDAAAADWPPDIREHARSLGWRARA